MIAIGGGGYIPARILRYVQSYTPTKHVLWLTYPFSFRSFLKRPGEPNIPIQAIGLSLYENLGFDDPEEVPGPKVTRTQWLDLSSLEMANLIGKNVLIVDEVDDTRTTLEYAVRELEKDVEIAQKNLGREGEKTTFSIFVLHVSVCSLPSFHSLGTHRICYQNKNKSKKGKLPEEMMTGGRYHAAVTTGDVWICYPWEAK
jgi:hypoxanthine phosphoribosyltransferase